jgi:hypothetical protein
LGGENAPEGFFTKFTTLVKMRDGERCGGSKLGAFRYESGANAAQLGPEGVGLWSNRGAFATPWRCFALADRTAPSFSRRRGGRAGGNVPPERGRR